MAHSKPRPLPFSLPMCCSFWLAVWVAPLRAALGASAFDLLSLAPPRWPVVRTLGPLWLQRQVAAAVAKRLAWQRQMGWRIVWQYEVTIAMIGWEAIARDGIALETRLEMDDDFLRWLLGLQLEILLRVVAGRGPSSDEQCLRCVAGTCWRVALLYGELRRRYKKERARTVVQEELRCFLGHLAQTA